MNCINKLYSIFFNSILNSLKNNAELEYSITPLNSSFYTTKGNLREWNTCFKKYISEYYAAYLKKWIPTLNITNIKDTTLYGRYNVNNFDPIDVSLITENKDELKYSKIIAPLLGENEVNHNFKSLFGSTENLTEEQILKLWQIFTYVFLDEATKNSINIFENSFELKNGVYYAIEDGYILVKKDAIEILPKETKLNTRTIFKLPIKSQDIKNWDDLKTNKDLEDYSIFKEFITTKIADIDTLSCVFADLLQPLINTEILPMMVGSGGTGKSTLQQFLTHILNEEIVGSVNLVQALNNPFEREVLYTHPIVFTSELESSSFKEQATLKQIVSREITQLNLKHQSVKKARPIAKLLVASNSTIKTTDSDGLNRRLCFIKFESRKIREDLNIVEFNKTFNSDVKGFVAFVIKGAQYLLNKGWNYNTFNKISNIELQREYEGQFSILNAFLSSLLTQKIIVSKPNSFVNLSTIADLLILLNESDLNSDYLGDETFSIIDSYNPRLESKRSLLYKLKGAGFEKLQTRINDRYNLEQPVDVIKVNRERLYKSNIGRPYRETTLLSNLAIDFNNTDFIELLKTSTITADKLEKWIPDFKAKLSAEMYIKQIKTDTYGEVPLKSINIKLISLFTEKAPMAQSLNQERITKDSCSIKIDEAFNDIWV